MKKIKQYIKVQQEALNALKNKCDRHLAGSDSRTCKVRDLQEAYIQGLEDALEMIEDMDCPQCDKPL